MSLNSTDTKTIRKFGLVALIFFGCLSALGLWREKSLPFYLFGLLSALGLGFILIPNSLKPVYVGWLKTAHFIGRVFTILVLTLAYYCTLFPTALIKRLFGGAPLPVKPNKKSSSYWVTREEPAQAKERYIKRY